MNDKNIFVKTDIKGSGNPLVLVPGGLTGWLSWEPHQQALSSEYKVIRTQLIAVDYGLESKSLPVTYSVDYETEALKNTLDNLNIEKADFAAWSYGAEVTLNFAINNPDRVRTLTLIEPPAIWVIKSRKELSQKLLSEQKLIQKLGPNEITEEQLIWFTHFAGFVPESIDPRTLPQWETWNKHKQSLRTQDVVFRHKDSIEKVRQFTKPVLLFRGEGSSEFLHEIIDILEEEFPNAKVSTLPGGHAPQIVAMKEFLEILTSFLNIS